MRFPLLTTTEYIEPVVQLLSIPASANSIEPFPIVCHSLPIDKVRQMLSPKRAAIAFRMHFHGPSFKVPQNNVNSLIPHFLTIFFYSPWLFTWKCSRIFFLSPTWNLFFQCSRKKNFHICLSTDEQTVSKCFKSVQSMICNIIAFAR